MSAAFEFVGGSLFLQPTPAGAYHAVAGPDQTPERRLLLGTMRSHASVRATVDQLCIWCGQPAKSALATAFRVQERGWIEGFHVPYAPPAGALEPIAVAAATALSSTAHGLLADTQGFCIASAGFEPAQAEFLAAVSADIASLHERHAAYLADASGTSSGAWAMVDMAGNSRVGFWPLFVGEERFVLALGGLPLLHRAALVDLVWTLTVRFGTAGAEPGGEHGA